MGSSLVDAVPSSWVRRFKSELNFAPINRMTSSRCHWFCNKEAQRGSCSNHFLQIESCACEQRAIFRLCSFAPFNRDQHLQVCPLAEVKRRSLWNGRLYHHQPRG